MNIILTKQGSLEWHAYRAAARNASEASAVLGCSPYISRTQLMQAIFTGVRPEATFHEQRIFDRGHAIEAQLRGVAEQIVGEDLYSLVGSEIVDGIELSASFDGLGMLEDPNWECKSLNHELRAAMPNAGPDGNDADNLPKHYRVQMEQQCAVSGCTRVLFTASDGKGDDRHCWYTPTPELRQELIASWKQFDADLALYIPPVAAPVAIGRVPETLPALRIEVTGMVTASNLAEYKTQAMAVLGSINRELSTDAQFADAETTINWCTDAESRLAAAKQHALSQTASIDELFRTIDDISAEARRVRLELDRLVKARKQEVRGELVAGGIAALRDHVEALNARLGKPLMPAIAADFAGSIKGRRTVESLRDAVNTELARAKIEASAVADRIQSNLALLQQHQALAFLFADIEKIVLKHTDDFAMLVKGRIDFHQAAEAAKEEATRVRIRAEEQENAERAAREAAATKRLTDQVALEAKINAAIAEQKSAPAQVSIASAAIETVAKPNAVVVPMNRPAITPDLAATIRLGQINELLAPYLQVSGANLSALGVAAVGRDKAAVLYRADDFPLMLAGLIDKLQAVQAKAAA